MKTLRILFLIISLLPFQIKTSVAQNINYSGEWKLNKEKTGTVGDQQYSLASIKINLTKDSLLTTRVYENVNGEEYSFDENLSLNDKESDITVFGMPRTAKASLSGKDGFLRIESTIVVNSEKHATNEIWSREKDGKTLTVSFTTITPGMADKIGKKYFEKSTKN